MPKKFLPSSNSRLLVIKRVISLSPNVTLWHGKDLRYQCFIEMQYIIALFSNNHSNIRKIYNSLYFVEVGEYFYQQQNALFLFHITKKMLPFELIVFEVEVKKLSIESHKKFYTRDFRITIIFRGIRIYLCYSLLRCRK